MDNKIIQVALDGLENILRVGEADRGDPPQPGSINKYALFIEEANGMEKIHECQQNSNQDIYKKAYHIIDTYSSYDYRSLILVTSVMMETTLIRPWCLDKKLVSSLLGLPWIHQRSINSILRMM